ncbi:ammonium transporter [Acidothermaceae bacterium B102]|nr:ammonium transporter [Acidothermaceae bacterium B102]
MLPEAAALVQAAAKCTATAVPTACQPSWLDTGSTGWQLTAATFVGLMSVPGLALLYGGLVPKKWVVNTMFMAFSGFSLVLVVWVLWAYKMGFGSPIGGGTANHWNYTYGSNFFKNFFYNFVGHPETSLRGTSEISQASLTANGGTAIPLSQPTTALFYFQFVFAAITPLLFLGSVLGRIRIGVWMIFVPLWSTFVYAVNAMLIWGGGYWAHEGAVDYSGGYVIHLAAGTSGFVAAWVIGPRLARDRAKFIPHSLPLVSIGAGIVWLGWNGFNGGDPYFASANAATAIVNTNLATVSALLTWVILDMLLSREKKPTFLGAINGMIVGLVTITPGAGYVNGLGAMLSAIIACVIVWFAWTYLQPILIRHVDDALGVLYTHGIAGLCGGLLVGIFADPTVAVYPITESGSAFAAKGWLYGNRHLFFIQLLAALTIIVWDGLVTFVILKVISIFTPLRMSDDMLEIGDLAIHGEEAYPSDDGYAVSALSSSSVGAGVPSKVDD